MWFEFIIAGALVMLYLGFWAWYSQGAGKLTQAEIDQYIARIEKLPLPAEEVRAFSVRLRPWAEADDGKQFYMFNLMHFFPRLQTFAGSPEFAGTPEQANAHYEKKLIWLWLSHASYPTFIGTPQARNLINMRPERMWENMIVVRYPSRRTFLKLISHPTYATVAAYKFMAVELDLAPVSSGPVAPDLRWLVAGAFAIIFLLIAWIHASLLL
ncbi:MAG TPA: hypothetical protein VFQ78_05930 [Candidatus Udaeobacter sp.]|jgi:hypothetical protein|nr:hypothetical protein [Candidatus Udaeobacter sp.]